MFYDAVNIVNNFIITPNPYTVSACRCYKYNKDQQPSMERPHCLT